MKIAKTYPLSYSRAKKCLVVPHTNICLDHPDSYTWSAYRASGSGSCLDFFGEAVEASSPYAAISKLLRQEEREKRNPKIDW